MIVRKTLIVPNRTLRTATTCLQQLYIVTTRHLQVHAIYSYRYIYMYTVYTNMIYQLHNQHWTSACFHFVSCQVERPQYDCRSEGSTVAIIFHFPVPENGIIYRSVVIFGLSIHCNILHEQNAAAVSLHEWDICFVFFELTNIRLAGGDIRRVTRLAAAEFPGASIYEAGK